MQSHLVFVSWVTYIIHCDEDERNAQIKPSVCILCITKVLSFFSERKGLFLYTSYERSLFFHSTKIVDFIFATAYCLSSCCCCCIPGWWRTRQIGISVTGPISLWTCQSSDLSINRPVNQYLVVEETPSIKPWNLWKINLRIFWMHVKFLQNYSII